MAHLINSCASERPSFPIPAVLPVFPRICIYGEGKNGKVGLDRKTLFFPVSGNFGKAPCSFHWS